MMPAQVAAPPGRLRPKTAREALHIRRPVWPHFFMALFGAGWAISFDFGVRVYGAEIVMAVGLLLIPWWSALCRHPIAWRILGAYVLWIAAIIISDLINSIAPFDSLRNMATPIMGGASMVFVLAVLARQPSALLTFLFATAITKSIFGEPLYGDAFADQALNWASIQADSNFFKVRVEPFFTPILLLSACWLGRRSLIRAAAVFALASICYFLLDARSSALTFFLTCITLVAIHAGLRAKPSQMLFGSFLAMVVGYGGYLLYADYTLTYNLDGHNGQQMQQMQNPYNPFELLSKGRSEWLVMPTAIAQRPVFGWGSWAKDENYNFTYLRMERNGSSDYRRITGESELYIPAHSLLGSTWLWSGFLGLLAMVWLFFSVWKMGLKLRRNHSALLPAALFLFIFLIWHYFFSPPQIVRLYFPIALAVLLVLTKEQTWDPSRRIRQ